MQLLRTNFSRRQYLIFFSGVTVYLLLMVLVVYIKHSRSRKVSPLETTISQIRLGWNVDEVNDFLGAPADSTKEIKGIVLNSMTMLLTKDLKKTKDGVPQEYVLRDWSRGDEIAWVVFDQTGKVVCRNAGSRKNSQPHDWSVYYALRRLGML